MSERRRVWVVEWGGTKGTGIQGDLNLWIPNSAHVEFSKACFELRDMRKAHPDQRFRKTRYVSQP